MTLVDPTHASLRTKSTPFDNGHDVRELVDEMFEIMGLKGIGLAAPQIGLNKRIFITGYGQKKVFINPKIVKKLGSLKKDTESCLSLPGIEVVVPRHEKVLIDFYDENWQHRREVFSGMLARVIQHEQDHLNGKLITDYK
jgi:peptide deformylase